MALSDALPPWLAAQCPGTEPDRIATAMAEWLEWQENEPWLSPAYRIIEHANYRGIVMTQEWIADRQPAKEDEDEDGEVLMQRFPDGRESSGGRIDACVAAAHVGPGVPWKRTPAWQPRATTEPEPEAPAPEPKPTLRVGQVWRIGNGPRRAGHRRTGRAHHPQGAAVVRGATGADVGAGWHRNLGDPEWTQRPPLPGREQPADA